MFVPDADFGSRKATAIALVGAYQEHGLSDRSVKATQGGFIITEELAAVLYAEAEPKSVPTKKTQTSGNRAVKKNSKEES